LQHQPYLAVPEGASGIKSRQVAQFESCRNFFKINQSKQSGATQCRRRK
jgi:hypothetical protein